MKKDKVLNFDFSAQPQKMLKHKREIIIAEIIVLCAFFIGFVIYGLNLINDYKDVQVARFGIEDVATVVDCRYYEDDDSKYYKIIYEYEIDGSVYKGSFESKKYLSLGEEIEIKHDGGARSVIATFPTNFFVAAIENILIFATLILSLISFIVLTIRQIIDYKFYTRLECGEGTRTYAKFVGQHEVTNNILFRIKYEYRDEFGKLRRGKSINYYPKEDVEYLKKKETFEIKYIGKISVVIEKTPSEIEWEKEQKAEEENQEHTCVYCGTKMAADEYECPACRAIRK